LVSTFGVNIQFNIVVLKKSILSQGFLKRFNSVPSVKFPPRALTVDDVTYTVILVCTRGASRVLGLHLFLPFVPFSHLTSPPSPNFFCTTHLSLPSSPNFFYTTMTLNKYACLFKWFGFRRIHCTLCH